MKVILYLFCLIAVVVTSGCIFREEGGGGRGHSEDHGFQDHGAGHDGDRDDHR